MPSFSCTPLTMSVASTVTYDALSTDWVLGTRTLVNSSGSAVIPPEDLMTSFTFGSISSGPMGATTQVTFTGGYFAWLLRFLFQTYTLVVMIAPEPGSAPLAARIHLRRSATAMLQLTASAAVKGASGAAQNLQARVEITLQLVRGLRRRVSSRFDG